MNERIGFVRMHRVVWLAVMIGSAPSVAGAQDAAAAAGGTTVGVTLAEALRRAIDIQPAMVTARSDVRNAGAAKREATGSYLPSLTTTGSATRAGGSRLNPSTNQIVSAITNSTYSAGLTLSVPLFQGFQRIATNKAASATEDAADAGLISQRFQTMLATKQVFYAALAAEELVRVGESQVRRMQEQLQISTEKLRAGSATKSDSLRATVDYGNSQIQLLDARAALATSQANLGRQVGVDGPVRPVRDSVPPSFPDTTNLRATVMQTAPVVVQTAAEARAAAARVTASRSSYWPQFIGSLSGGYSGAEWPWAESPQYFDNWSVRLGFSWTLFNGFTRERALTQAHMSRDIAQARADDERRGAGAALTQELAALTSAYEQISIARSNVVATTEDLRVQQERYRVGAATFLDLLVSQEALTNAEVAFVQRRFDFVVARARLEALVGREL